MIYANICYMRCHLREQITYFPFFQSGCNLGGVYFKEHEEDDKCNEEWNAALRVRLEEVSLHRRKKLLIWSCMLLWPSRGGKETSRLVSALRRIIILRSVSTLLPENIWNLLTSDLNLRWCVKVYVHPWEEGWRDVIILQYEHSTVTQAHTHALWPLPGRWWMWTSALLSAPGIQLGDTETHFPCFLTGWSGSCSAAETKTGDVHRWWPDVRDPAWSDGDVPAAPLNSFHLKWQGFYESPDCLQNCLHSSCHKFNEVLDTFLRDFGSYMTSIVKFKKTVCDDHGALSCWK